MGYRDVTHEKLMYTVAGRSFIRASVSFESFIPANLDEVLAKKLVTYYLSMLREYPDRRDKVEFEIVFSSFEPDFSSRVKVLTKAGFSQNEQENLQKCLLGLTNDMFVRVDDDLATVALLTPKIATVKRQKSKDIVNRLREMVQLTQTFGTLPFANLARCAFAAITLLKSLNRTGHLSDVQLSDFMESLCTVGKKLSDDLKLLRQGEMGKNDFLAQYGHLRPGTYDICTPRYDESFEL